MNLFDEDKEKKTAVGGLSLLNALKGKIVNENSSSDGSPWGDIWKARGGFTFSMKKGEEARIILLEDVQVFVACPVLVGWVEKSQFSFPKIEYVRSPAYDDKGEATGTPDFISEVTGMSPTLIGVAPILDLRSFTDKNEKTHQYAFRPLLIKSGSVLDQLTTFSEHYGRSLQWAQLQVTRSATEKKAPAAGGNYFLKSFVDPAELAENIPDLEEGMKKVDVTAGYPRPDIEMAKRLLGLHVAVCEKHKDKKTKVVEYNREAWEALKSGKQIGDITADDQFEGLEDTTPEVPAATETPAPVEAPAEFDLSDLDDVLGG